MATIDTLIIDLDNTLIDRNAALRQAMKLLLQEMNDDDIELHTALDAIMQFDNWGYTDRYVFGDWVQQRYGRGMFSTLAREPLRVMIQEKMIAHIRPDAMVQSTLQQLGKHYRLVLASNGSSKAQRAKLQQAALTTFFAPEAIFISGEMTYEKPDPQFFTTIIDLLHLQPERTMAIGDHLQHDIEAAAVCGLHTCWVSHGRNNLQDAIRPGRIISTITDTGTWSKQLI